MWRGTSAQATCIQHHLNDELNRFLFHVLVFNV